MKAENSCAEVYIYKAYIKMYIYLKIMSNYVPSSFSTTDTFIKKIIILFWPALVKMDIYNLIKCSIF